MAQRTPLFDEHQRLGARIVPFGGWEMPLHYGSQIEEHHAVRNAAGMFDVSHMRPVDLSGTDVTDYLRRLLANDVARLKTPGKALYGCMLNEHGGVVDDLIVYWRGAERYRAVVNAATAAGDIAWMRRHAAGLDVNIEPREDLAMIAIQGPKARERAAALLPEALSAAALELAPFHSIGHEGWFVARTGYTGEDGFEVLLPGTAAPDWWRRLIEADIQPCGLGARDTLRLEAGMNLYGQDMDTEIGPLDAGLGWTVAWEPSERDFIGRAALTARRDSPERCDFVGVLLSGRGIIRPHQPISQNGKPIGEVTSGGFSPTLGRSIGLARVVAGSTGECAVTIRNQAVTATLLAPPFVRHGKILVDV